MNEELRQVRDTLIEALRRSETLTIEGRALFARYAAMSEAETSGVAVPGPEQPGPTPPRPAQPAVAAAPRGRSAPTEEDEEFSGSFMVRNNPPAQPNIPGYRETPAQQVPNDLPRSMRDRRR